MKCPSCNTGVYIEWDVTNAFQDDFKNSDMGAEIHHGQCPECDGIIVKLVRGKLGDTGYIDPDKVTGEEILYPKFTTRFVESEVPEPYKSEFKEATAILNISPKASAALSRRILQNILHQQYSIQKSTLADEIEEFIKRPGVPSHLVKAIDAIRNIGNFGAHPLKDKHTGEIVDVEPGEAEWLLEVLEALFDYAFVQPKRLDERAKKLNDKLKQCSKPPMKK